MGVKKVRLFKNHKGIVCYVWGYYGNRVKLIESFGISKTISTRAAEEEN